MRVTNTAAKILQSVLLAGFFTSVAGCKATEEQPPVDPSLANSEPAIEAERKKVVPPMNLTGQIEFSKKDLAKRLDVSPESVVLSSARQVTWRSGALGCPQPGMNYTDALVPGAVIYLQAGKSIHAYHAKFAGEPFYCPRERVEQPVADEGMDPT